MSRMFLGSYVATTFHSCMSLSLVIIAKQSRSAGCTPAVLVLAHRFGGDFSCYQLAQKKTGVWEIAENFSALVTLVSLVDLPKLPGLLVAHWEFPESLVAFSGEQSNCRSFAPFLLSIPVGKWSANLSSKSPHLLAHMGFCQPSLCAHNPEAAGSSPAAATIKDLKSRDFRSFLSFWVQKSRTQNLRQ